MPTLRRSQAPAGTVARPRVVPDSPKLKPDANGGATTPSPRPLTGAAAASKAKAASGEKKPPRPKVTKACLCGCNTQTFGTFAPGHDAKYKQRLIQTAMTGNKKDVAEAERALAARNWSRFLDKAIEIASRPKAEPRAMKEKSDKVVGKAPKGTSQADYDEAVAILDERGIEAGKLTSKEVDAILDGTYFDDEDK